MRFDAFWQESRKHMINTVDVDGMPIKIVNDADNINRQTGAGLQTDWQMATATTLSRDMTTITMRLMPTLWPAEL